MKPTFFDKKTCGTCKKAQVYLNESQVEFEKVDIINSPPSREILEKFIDENDVKPHLNSRSTIYRELKLGQNIPDKSKAIELMLQDPNLIKRPFIVKGSVASFGFTANEFDEKWGTSSN
ncbi:MAG: Spx/MgsR family RNA polymerase-binding regulatory protein [Candidatus Marinimicrobia bacterium]|jgi:arsenate reductase (glutaredoxin)|nr:Spx/MgsR family RNA polymerase-binding regulatory protein [Candidatus Neomarinimicrobiota bacterium]MBT4362726.1 Spx/MgsR family RNA polymerase-binding regulatory protein [Candidatus Neomarinimicrobiota bacterium]MBT4714233.1 Spx/MgsR family RNA polymerase-binding regulatory protein [Candidatus Neomarinimicrobiota bacterium]MBT4993420.1 Spx/MgsR family RNA polymerase-binding regulatory protein [Candidatus Neomarinimicrobiota bacterium]MBT5314107.1 Spx/MgsR family RNA polymerase-binding regul